MRIQPDDHSIGIPHQAALSRPIEEHVVDNREFLPADLSTPVEGVNPQSSFAKAAVAFALIAAVKKRK